METSVTPQRESRVKKTLLNARVNLIFYFLTLILSFFSRKIFLDCLGTDFIGLTGTLENLLGFLNLAELGIATAIGYLLYKPLFDHDETKISEIISVMGYLYRWIGLFILGAGIILSFFLPFIFPDTDTHLTLIVIYCAYYAFLGSTLIGYFINYRQNLLGADQRNYVVTAYFQSVNIIKILIQMGLAYYTRNLFLWILIEFIFGIVYSFILNWKINQTYPWLKTNIKDGKQLLKRYPEVILKTKQLFIHKIGSIFQFQVIPFLIYAFSSLSLVALYQNYTIIFTKINALFNNLFAGLDASVGNLIAEGNKNKIDKIFWELQDLRFFIAGLICTPLFLLTQAFITVWLGSNYLLSKLVLIVILVPMFINIVKGALDSFIYGYGLFWDVWSPIVECILLLMFSIIGGYFWNLPGVLLGPIISRFIIFLIWKPILLFKWGLHSNPVWYWTSYIKNLILILIAGTSTYYICDLINLNHVSDFLNWTWMAIVITIAYGLSSYILFLCFSKGIKIFNQRIILYLTKTRFFKKI